MRYLIEGFEVWMSPSLEDNPAYTDEYLDRYLDIVQAQLLYMDSEGVIPREAMNALRDSGLTFYVDDPDNQQEWWPCAPGPGGCYSPGLNRIGGSFWGNAGNVMNGWHWQSFILHEAAHAYHWKVITDGFNNACVLDAYDRNKHRYEHVENSARASGIPPEHGVQIVQHWAYRTAMEYFVEMSEAYFFRGTSYPWNRIELYRHDSEGYFLVREAWTNPAFCENGFRDSLSDWLTYEEQQQVQREVAEQERTIWETVEREAAGVLGSACAVSRTSLGRNDGLPFVQVGPSHVSMRTGAWVDALILNGQQHGGNGGQRGDDLRLLHGEYINRAAIGAGVYVDRLEFRTNFGRSISGGRSMAGSTRRPIILNNIRVLSIGGSSERYLNGIDVMYCADYES